MDVTVELRLDDALSFSVAALPQEDLKTGEDRKTGKNPGSVGLNNKLKGVFSLHSVFLLKNLLKALLFLLLELFHVLYLQSSHQDET